MQSFLGLNLDEGMQSSCLVTPQCFTSPHDTSAAARRLHITCYYLQQSFGCTLIQINLVGRDLLQHIADPAGERGAGRSRAQAA
jgi:hypothetical protein